MDYLKLETVPSPALEVGYTASALSTPLSASCNDRRGSIASSQWSFNSNAPSVVSFQSSHGPVTPPGQGGLLSNNFSVASLSMSWDDTSLENRLGTAKECLLEQPLPLQFHHVVNSSDNALHPGSDWVVPQQPHQNGNDRALRLTFQTHDGMMPASGDFPSAFESSLAQPSTQSLYPSVGTLSSSSSLSSWESYRGLACSELSHGLPYVDYESLSTNEGLGLSYNWSSAIADHSEVPSLSGSPSTIAPTQTFIETGLGSYSDLHSDSFEDDFSSFNEYSSERAYLADDVYPMVKSEHEQDNLEAETSLVGSSPTMFGSAYNDDSTLATNRSICVTRTGAKGLKKERRGSSVSRRRCRSEKLRAYSTNLGGTKVEVKVDHDLPIDAHGKARPYERQRKSSYACGERLPDGSICNRSFVKIEHLKRHQRSTTLHTEDRPHLCVVDRCSKAFNRNDNLLAHYLTHVKRSKNQRNDRITLEEMVALIRRSESPEHAEKTILGLKKALQKKREEEAKLARTTR